MPELPQCQNCASCCYQCIFLTYSDNAKQFSCRIYKNKWRRPIHPFNRRYKVPKGFDYYYGTPSHYRAIAFPIFMKEIEGISTHNNCRDAYSNQICHNFVCTSIKSIDKIIEDRVTPQMIQLAKDIDIWAHKYIKDFETLIEILNSGE